MRPKPMVEIGGRPVLWHILKIYSAHGINDFVICLGYKGYLIKEYFANYFLHMSDVTFDMASNQMQVHHQHAEPWQVTLVDTGEATQTGGRLKRVQSVRGRRGLLLHLRRRPQRRQRQRPGAISPAQRDGRDADGHPAARALRRARRRRHADHDLRGEATRRRFADQRRFLRAFAPSVRLHRRRRQRSGSADRSSGWRASANCPPSCTMASGSRWTRCATRTCSNRSGSRARHPGRYGDRVSGVDAASS